ncbi:MAG TPA: ribonuclease domain-containing protein [Burkholderiales bacterium]|nr:ribonuclease domain-containing protein [Burkholderiales bacterium]
MSELALRIAIRCGLFAAALAVVFAGLVPASSAQPRVGVTAAVVALADLPPEARQTVVLIRRGGPFPYERDGIVFGNFEKRLPARERGYYREYTVPTPGLKHRGARRIVSGRGRELYYSDDHYQSFRRIRE